MTRLATVKQERDEAQRKASLYQDALHLALTETPDHIEEFREDNGPARYALSAYGLTRCHGGIVITRFVHPGQRDSVSVAMLDTLNSEHRYVSHDGIYLSFALAIERISTKRHFMLNQEKTA